LSKYVGKRELNIASIENINYYANSELFLMIFLTMSRFLITISIEIVLLYFRNQKFVISSVISGKTQQWKRNVIKHRHKNEKS